MWGNLNLRDELPVGKPMFIATLKINYRDGTTEEVVTDRSWKYAYGPVVKNNVYLGEVYDAGMEIPGWNRSEFSGTNWKKPVRHKGPGGNLQKVFFPTIQVTDTIRPVAVLSPGQGVQSWIWVLISPVFTGSG